MTQGPKEWVFINNCNTMNMKSFFYFVVILFALCACGAGNNGKTSYNSGPRLQIDSVINMGDFEGPRFKKFTKIPYSNVGTDTLYILSCMGSCECVELVLSDSVLPPGGSGVITAYLDLTEKPLRTNEQPFFILSNDPRHETDVVLVGTKK